MKSIKTKIACMALAVAGFSTIVITVSVLARDGRKADPPEKLVQYAFELVNKARKETGAKPVKLSGTLSRFAQAHAQDMLDKDYFSHSDRSGQNAQQRARKAGISSGIFENLGWQEGPDSYTKMLDDLHASFMSEPPGQMNHRGILLKSELCSIGIGIAKGKEQLYLVQVFTEVDPDEEPID